MPFKYVLLFFIIWLFSNKMLGQEDQLRPEGILTEYAECPENCEGLYQGCLDYIATLETGSESARARMMLTEVLRDKGLWNEKITAQYALAKSEFEGAGDNCGLAQAFVFDATFHGVLGDLDKSIALATKSVKISENCDLPIVRASGLKALGYAYASKGEYAEALVKYQKAYEIYRDLGDPEGEGMATQEMASIYASMGDFGKNKEMMFQSAALYKEAGAEFRYAGCMIDICANFLSENQPDSVLKYIPDVIETVKGKWQMGESYAIYNLGEAYKQKKRYDKALEAYARAAELSQGVEQARFKSEIEISRSECYTGMGQFEKAYASILKAEALSEQYFDLEGRLNVLQFLMYTAHDVGEHDVSHQAALDFIELNDSLRGEARQQEVLALQEAFEAERRIHQIEVLEAEKALGYQKRNALLIVIAVLLISAFLVLNREIQRRKKAKLLFETEIRLKESNEKRLHEELEFKKRELASKALHISQKNQVLEQLRSEVNRLAAETEAGDAVRDVINTLRMERTLDNNWDEFTQQFIEINPEFYKKLDGIASDMTQNDYRMAALMRMNLNSKEIASMLNISTEGVKKARHRFRKKLNLPSDENIESFIAAL